MTHPFPLCGTPRKHSEEIANMLTALRDARPGAEPAARAARVAELLARLSPDEALDWLREIVLAEGGTWCEPPKADPMSTELPAEWPPSHLMEITVLGIFAAGRTTAELIDNWRQAAKRVGRAA